MKTPVSIEPIGRLTNVVTVVFDDKTSGPFQIKKDAAGNTFAVLDEGRLFFHLFCPQGGRKMPEWEDGDIVLVSNFSQDYDPSGPLLIDDGKKVLFIECRLCNCKTTIPPKGGNVFQGIFPHQTETPPDPKEEAYQTVKVMDAEWLKQRAMSDFQLAPVEKPLAGKGVI